MNNKNYKLFSAFSPNQVILTNSKSLRNFLNISPTSTTFNHNLLLNSLATYFKQADQNIGTSNFFFYNLSATN